MSTHCRQCDECRHGNVDRGDYCEICGAPIGHLDRVDPERIAADSPALPVYAPARLVDRILVVYSVNGTPSENLEFVEGVLEEYRRQDTRTDRLPNPWQFCNVEGKRFDIPAGAAPGATLGSELAKELEHSIGAIVFVDDLTPNIAYEIGYFHGRGKTVLLLTSSEPQRAWTIISDIAGAALAEFSTDTLKRAVFDYLDRVFAESEKVPRWASIELPSQSINLFSQLPPDRIVCKPESHEIVDDGPFGRFIRVWKWDHAANIVVGTRVLPDSRFKFAVRGVPGSEYAIYFLIRFADWRWREREAWFGLSSWLTTADLRSDERNLPADPPGTEWRMVVGTFADLMRGGHVIGAHDLLIQRIRFRAGRPHSSRSLPVDIGLLDITGTQR